METYDQSEKINAILQEEVVLINSKSDIEKLQSRGYGIIKDNNLLLNPYESLYLQDKKIIEIQDQLLKKNLTFENLLEKKREKIEDVWFNYLIYRDLRNRGYVVREGFSLGINFRVYKRGEYGKGTADYLILGIREGQPMTILDLSRILKHVQSLKKMLILAVLNRRGEIVYYSLSNLFSK